MGTSGVGFGRFTRGAPALARQWLGVVTEPCSPPTTLVYVHSLRTMRPIDE
jgi:hypothetical protein